MSNEEINRGLIQGYLSGDLTTAEEKSFKDRVESDPEFKELYESECLIFETVVMAELFELENQVRTFEPKKKNAFWRFLGLGLLIASGLSVFLYSEKTTDRASAPKRDVITKEINIAEEKDEVVAIIEELSYSDEVLEDKPSLSQKEVVEKQETVLSEESNAQVVALISQEKEKLLPPKVKQEKEIGVTHPTLIEDPCSSVIITFEEEVSPACELGEDGSIEVLEVVGGESPYMLLSVDVWTMEGENKMIFLAEGEYELFVKDANGCESEIKSVFVGSKICEEEGEYSMSVSQGGFFEVKSSGRLTIVSEVGEVILDDHVVEGFKWFGSSSTGRNVPFGVYNYMLSNRDGISSGVINVLD